MLTVYSASWCSHCQKTIEWLEKRGISFEIVDIETAPETVVRAVIDANGGDDWVVPTLLFDGKWRPGKVFQANVLETDLKSMGII